MAVIDRLLHLPNMHHNGIPQAETVTKLQQLAMQLHLKMISQLKNPSFSSSMSKSPTEIASCCYNSATHLE